MLEELMSELMESIADSREFGIEDAWMFLPQNTVGGTENIESAVGTIPPTA